METGHQRPRIMTQRYFHRSSKDKDQAYGGRTSMTFLPHLCMEFAKYASVLSRPSEQPSQHSSCWALQVPNLRKTLYPRQIGTLRGEVHYGSGSLGHISEERNFESEICEFIGKLLLGRTMGEGMKAEGLGKEWRCSPTQSPQRPQWVLEWALELDCPSELTQLEAPWLSVCTPT